MGIGAALLVSRGGQGGGRHTTNGMFPW